MDLSALPLDFKVNIFGIDFNVTDYDRASDIIISNAKKRNSIGMTALAVHGLIESLDNTHMFTQLKKISLIVPDGQPIRWVINSFYKLNLKAPVTGPNLTIEVLKKAEKEDISIYLYGSKPETLNKLINNYSKRFPNIKIVGIHPDRFREATHQEDLDDIRKINDSGAGIVLVGRGCPRQELWVANHVGKINAVMMAVGAAFDFHAGTLKKAPEWMQRNGLEWFFRLMQEPKRLWRRYLYTNSIFIFLYIKHKLFNKIIVQWI